MNEAPEGFVPPSTDQRISDAKLATYAQMASEEPDTFKEVILHYEVVQMLNELVAVRAYMQGVMMVGNVTLTEEQKEVLRKGPRGVMIVDQDTDQAMDNALEREHEGNISHAIHEAEAGRPADPRPTDFQAFSAPGQLRLIGDNIFKFYGELVTRGIKTDVTRQAREEQITLHTIAGWLEGMVKRDQQNNRHRIAQNDPRVPRGASWGDVVMIDGKPHVVGPSAAQVAENAEARAWSG